ncbi:hypothetical protein [Ilyobacter polytropus]|uniref:hypothetical protein n=1 Tax=Ilyobacter polytropus TaxID=167642 RepID=UPI0003030201
MKTIIYKNGTMKKNLRDELQTQLPPVSSIDLFNIKEAEKTEMPGLLKKPISYIDTSLK